MSWQKVVLVPSYVNWTGKRDVLMTVNKMCIIVVMWLPNMAITWSDWEPFHTLIKNQRTIGPVSLTWVLRICWIRTNFEIQEHSMLYKLSPIQKCQEQIWSRSTQGHHLKKKCQGMGIQLLGTSSGSILKLYYSRNFVPVPERSLLPHYFLFYLIYVSTRRDSL